MNKKIIFGIGIFLIFVLFVIIKVVILNTKDTKELELTYTSIGGIPYNWEYKIEDESIVQFVKTKDITPEKERMYDGGPVYINYIFKGIREGMTTITFKYVSIIDGSIEKEDKVTVKVDKYNNISLIAMP